LGNTVYRIHGTNQPSTIGTFVSSGCIRLTNEDVMDLYSRVRVGTRVVVLSGRPSTAATNSFASPSAMPPGTVTAASPGPVSSPMAGGASTKFNFNPIGNFNSEVCAGVLDAAPLLGPTISAIFGLLHLAFVAGLRS